MRVIKHLHMNCTDSVQSRRTMTINLKIDNLDALPDGGPLSYQSQRPRLRDRPRAPRLDAARSEHVHFRAPLRGPLRKGRLLAVRFFAQRHLRQRLAPAHQEPAPPCRRRPHPDRSLFRDGVDRRGARTQRWATSSSAPPPSRPASADDIWDTGAPSPPPIDRRELMPPQRRGKRSADFSEQFLEMPIKPLPELDSGRAPAQRPADANPFGGDASRSKPPFGGDARRRARFRRFAPPPPAPAPFSLQSEGFAPPPAPPPTPVRPPSARPFEAPLAQLCRPVAATPSCAPSRQAPAFLRMFSCSGRPATWRPKSAWCCAP